MLKYKNSPKISGQHTQKCQEKYVENGLPIKFRNEISSGSHGKKCLTLTQIRALSHDINHRTKKCHHQSATRLWKCKEIPFWYVLYPFWLAWNRTSTDPNTGTNFWWFFGWFQPVFHSRSCGFSVQNSGHANLSWEKLQRCVFRCILQIRTRIWKDLDLKYIICWDTKLVGFGYPQL